MLKLSFGFLLILYGIGVCAQVNVIDYLKSKGTGKDTYAIIIANEDYQSNSEVYTENEELAIYQAERFEQSLIKKLGVLPGNIIFYPDATNTHIKLAIAKLSKSIPARSDIIFFYRGKTYSESGELYLVPVDVSDNETFFMFSLKDLSTRLSAITKGRINIFIDSQPGKKSGTVCILENGFTTQDDYAAINKNLALLTLKTPAGSSEIFRDVVVPDAAKPDIIITQPSAKESETYESSILIRGSVKSGCNLMVISVKGQEAHMMPDGSFSARVNLEEGENNIAIEAKNCGGWTREELNITRIVNEEGNAQNENQGEGGDITTLVKEGINYGIVIGISKYKDPVMPDLYYPLQDARKVRDVIVNDYTFDNKNVILLENPTKEKIINTLDSLKNIITSNDNLLLFYAGHGTWDERTSMGYWLPSDAAARVYDNWIMNSIITGYVSQINARHTLVIADACFGGSIFRTRAFIPEEEKSLSDLYIKTSKKAMTSGDMTEVPDVSIFVKNFLQMLSDNKEDYLPSEQLFFRIKPTVVDAIDLIPQFGIIKNSGDQGGDFIFFRRK